MRTADPDRAADDAIEAIRRGLDRHFSETARQRLSALRKRVADRIERDLALLDVLAGNVDLEDADSEMTAVEWTGAGAHRFNRGVAA
ncbi:hypothetical protein FV226_21775 [Methylobacterium sp. WL12]|uniref:hypothetical protein n=1 Tax=Methylobacterium sp. WL12 TaxID=2603890 RepID=UPI0011CA3B9A|nr:hypothetical protein [Methylobacterium sp. WL12]TXM67464.1 hypothetical protein FV226_21775 [Methylobacterium sp. WL12]